MTLASRGPQFPCSEDLRSLSGQPQWGWLSYPCAPPSRTQLTPPPLPAVSLCLQAGWLKSESAPESWAWMGAEVFVALWQGSSVLGGFEIAK